MILAVGNTKGGVGKTTLAVNLAVARALEGGQLDNIDQLAGFDNFSIIGGIKGIAASLLREGQSGVAVQGNLCLSAIYR